MVAAAARGAGGSRAAEVDLVDDLHALREDWTRLAAANGNIFATWEWNELWWRHYGRGRRLRLGISAREGEVDAIVPLFAWSNRPFRVLRLPGHGHGEHLGPICGEEDAERAFRRALAAEAHDLFAGDWLAGGPSWARVLGGRVVRTTGYPILHFGGRSWDEFLAERSKRFRKSVRHSRNRLEREHEVGFRYTEPATLERDLDAVFRLHRARFGAHGGCRFCGEHEAFQREFAAIALGRGWLRLLFLELDGVPVCCEYGFSFLEEYFAYQGGRDPAWERESVGFVLEAENIRRSLEHGAAAYRFLGGEEPYKYRLPTEDPRLETVLVPASGRGRAASAALAAAWRLPAGRALLRRVGA